MVDIQTISIVIAATSVVIGVINSMLASRRAEQQRQMQLISQIYNRILDKDYVADFNELLYQWDFDDYEDYKPKYSVTTGKLHKFNIFSRVVRLMAHTCQLIHNGTIDVKHINETLSYSIIRFWEKYEPVMKGSRQVFNDPLLFDDIESVYPILKKQRQQQIDLLTQQQATIST